MQHFSPSQVGESWFIPPLTSHLYVVSKGSGVWRRLRHSHLPQGCTLRQWQGRTVGVTAEAFGGSSEGTVACIPIPQPICGQLRWAQWFAQPWKLLFLRESLEINESPGIPGLLEKLQTEPYPRKSPSCSSTILPSMALDEYSRSVGCYVQDIFSVCSTSVLACLRHSECLRLHIKIYTIVNTYKSQNLLFIFQFIASWNNTTNLSLIIKKTYHLFNNHKHPSSQAYHVSVGWNTVVGNSCVLLTKLHKDMCSLILTRFPFHDCVWQVQETGLMPLSPTKSKCENWIIQ